MKKCLSRKIYRKLGKKECSNCRQDCNGIPICSKKLEWWNPMDKLQIDYAKNNQPKVSKGKTGSYTINSRRK